MCVCVCVCVCARALHLTRLLTSTVIRILVISVTNEYEVLVMGKKTFSSRNLYNTTSTLTVLGSNPSLRSEKPAPSRLIHGTAMISNSAECLERDVFLIKLKIQLENN